MEKAGIFALVDVNSKESDLLLSYIRNVNKTPALDFVNYMIGMDYLKFLDLLAGTTLKVPSRKSLYRDIEYVKIYNYVKERSFEIEAIRTASRVYGKNISFVKRAILKISKCVGEDLPMTYEELANIKNVFDDKRFENCKDEWAFEGVNDEDSCKNEFSRDYVIGENYHE